VVSVFLSVVGFLLVTTVYSDVNFVWST